MRESVSLLSGLAIPNIRLRVVLRHSLAGVIHPADSGLRSGIALISGLAEPRESLRALLGSAIAFQVHGGEQSLRAVVP